MRIPRAGPGRLDELRRLFVARHEHHSGVTTAADGAAGYGFTIVGATRRRAEL